MKLQTILTAAATLLTISCCNNTPAPAEQPDTEAMKNKVYSISMNKICKEWDGQWQGMAVASDGNCYFGSSTHAKSHGAGFHKFDPRTYRHTMLVEDMTYQCGEQDLPFQQGKIHSPIVECDGWLYFCTHLSNYWKEGIEAYPGAHVFGYEMATGEFRDFGIVKERYSIYSAIAVDPVLKKLYVFSVPFVPELYKEDGCHLMSIDIATGEKKDCGKVVDGRLGASFWFFVDKDSNVWFTLWKRNYVYENDFGNLYCYNPEADSIKVYDNVLPKGQLIDETPVSEARNEQRAWTWLSPFPGRDKCYFIQGTLGGGDERLWIFDPSKDIVSGEAFEPVAYIGSSYFETAVGGDRLYFCQYEDLEDARTLFSEDEREVDPDSEGYVDRRIHLRSISLTDEGLHREIKDHGPLVDQDGRPALMIMSMAADNDGHVFVYGSWRPNSFKEATLQYLLFEYPNGDLYRLLKRGEFFAVIDTNE